MDIRQAFIEDAQDIAKLYIAAFPESIERFFPKKSQSQLLKLLKFSFALIFLWGGDGLVITDENNEIYGYCLYSERKTKPLWQNLTKALPLLAKMVSNISLPEIGRLLHNQLIILYSTKRIKEITKPEATILSIAIYPTYQGQGVGTLFLQTTLLKLNGKSVALNVRTDNLAGRRLYAKTGFEKYGQFRDLAGKWQMLIRT